MSDTSRLTLSIMLAFVFTGMLVAALTHLH